MRFVAAIVSFVLAFILIGFGIAQRTVFAEPDRVVAASTTDSDAVLSVLEGSALNAHDGRQKVEVSGSERVVAVYGRTGDIEAWVGDASYNRLTVDEETGELVSSLVRGSEQEVPDAIGSDLWLGEYAGEAALDFTLNVPEGVSVLIMSTGVDPAPSTVSVTWPVDNRTPWSGPLVVGGVILLLLGIGLYLWAFNHLRKARGPRRTPPPNQPKLPRQPRYSARKAAKAIKSPDAPKQIESSKGRRSTRRMTAVLPVVVVSALVLGGCSADAWPDFSGDAEASPSASPGTTVETVSAVKDVAVTEVQLKRIMKQVADVAGKADAELNAELLATRFEGPALELRTASYTKRAADAEQPGQPAIAAEPIALSLPQQTDIWPRYVLVVVQDPADEAVVPTALVLKQATPRDNYKAQYVVMLQATTFPEVAGASVGAIRYSPDNKLLKLAPEEVAKGYADIIANGEASEYADEFDLASDTFLPQVGPDAKAGRVSAVTGPAALTSEPVEGTGDRVALATEDTGAILVMSFGDRETVAPTEAQAEITVGDAARLLTGLSTTKKGVFVNYGYQLLFYVPPAGSSEKVRLLGATQGTTSAGELP
ncbi:hypothetical protein FB562_0701 [Homoserinimonas aerilata]|uniref:DUF8094 domain-containing protein n=1 Tax=Homoserinimonas aerilata TaxID=1162970 RepID=A0A542YHR9_9MICO|nr:hypothetical protein [Homoserinimonas aerilata]TQL47635.1 hypothetical protein FB562_0701 [Homoserinimonas aerilata]